MRKITYFCDKCKKQIEESDVHDLLIRATDNEGPNDAHYDLCFACICEETKKLFNLFKEEDKPEVKEEPKTVPKEEPKKEKSVTEVPMKVDKGKILALRNAGWKYKDIADEIGVDEKKITNILYQMRKKGECK